jgi:hypothetical protein
MVTVWRHEAWKLGDAKLAGGQREDGKRGRGMGMSLIEEVVFL